MYGFEEMYNRYKLDLNYGVLQIKGTDNYYLILHDNEYHSYDPIISTDITNIEFDDYGNITQVDILKINTPICDSIKINLCLVSD